MDAELVSRRVKDRRTSRRDSLKVILICLCKTLKLYEKCVIKQSRFYRELQKYK